MTDEDRREEAQRREKSHRESLNDIAVQALDEDEVPVVAFAAFVYPRRTDFTHTAQGGTTLSAPLDAVASHIAAVAQVSGEDMVDIAATAVEIARRKRDDGMNEWREDPS